MVQNGRELNVQAGDVYYEAIHRVLCVCECIRLERVVDGKYVNSALAGDISK